MSTLAHRIKVARKARKLSQEELAGRLGLTSQAVSNYETGKRSVATEQVSAFADALGVDRLWLLTGEGDMLLPDQGDGGKREVRHPEQEDRLYSSDQNSVTYPALEGGPGGGDGGVQYPGENTMTLSREVVASWTSGRVPTSEEAYWTRVQGTSMEPWLPNRTWIFVERCREIIDGERYVVYLDDVDAEVVKRVERIGEGVVHLVSDHPAHRTRRLRRLDPEEADDDMYHDLDNGVNVRMRVRGRVVFPSDTAHAILLTFARQFGEVLKASR